MTTLEKMGAAAKQAARKLAVAGNQKDAALEAIAAALESHTEAIWLQTRRTFPQQKKMGCPVL